MNESPSDLLALLIALIALLTSKEIAILIGPYAAICVLACAGAGLSLSSTDKIMTSAQALRYVAFRILVAICFTVAIAELLQLFAASMKPRYTLIPIAFFLGWCKDYNLIASWIGERIAAMVRKKTDE